MQQDAQGRWVSDDGHYYWDGAAWQELTQAQPAGDDASSPGQWATAYQPQPSVGDSPNAAPTIRTGYSPGPVNGQPTAPEYGPVPTYATGTPSSEGTRRAWVLPAAIAAVVVVIVGLVIGLVLANNNDKNDKTASPGNSMSPNAASSSSAAPSSATSSAPATAPSSGAPSASVAGSDAVVQGLKNEFARIRGAAPAGEPKSTRANKSTYSTSYEWGWDVPKGDGDLQKAETALAQKLAGYGYTQDDSSNADGPSCRVTSTSSYCSYYLKGSNGYTAELFMTSFSGSLDDGTVTFDLTLEQKSSSDS